MALVTPPIISDNKTATSPNWLSRLYWILPDLLRPALGKVVANLVLDDDSRIAVRAIRFFSEKRDAGGRERLTTIARERGAQMATVPDPDYSGHTLEEALLSVLQGRGFRRDALGQWADPEALEILRRAALAGRFSNLAGFVRFDLPWVTAHAVEIVIAAPKLLEHVLWILKDQPSELRDNAYRHIAHIGPVMRMALRQRIQAEFEGEERERMLATIEGNS